MYFHQMAGVKMFTAASCIITKNWNDPFYGGVDKQIVVCSYNGVLHNNKKNKLLKHTTWTLC